MTLKAAAEVLTGEASEPASQICWMAKTVSKSARSEPRKLLLELDPAEPVEELPEVELLGGRGVIPSLFTHFSELSKWASPAAVEPLGGG